jgi:flagellar assembly factor FliW
MSAAASAARLVIPAALDTVVGGAEATIAFPAGLPGFEDCRRFVLLSSDDASPFHCLRGSDAGWPSFITVDPRVVLPGYRTILNPEDADRLHAAADAPLLWLSLLTVDPAGRVFANLRAPVVINPTRMLGAQVLPHDSLYSLRHPLPTE